MESDDLRGNTKHYQMAQSFCYLNVDDNGPVDYDSDWLERDEDDKPVHNSTMFDSAPKYAAEVNAKSFEDPMHPVRCAFLLIIPQTLY